MQLRFTRAGEAIYFNSKHIAKFYGDIVEAGSGGSFAKVTCICMNDGSWHKVDESLEEVARLFEMAEGSCR